MIHKWYRLDNAAIIVPCSVGGFDTRVFRLSCELKEEIEPKILQEAVDETYKDFPHFNTALRKGVFWYYLEEIDDRPDVREEKQEPLAPLYIPGKRALLYEVTYEKNRVNLEMFHVLSDGTGALVFFKEIIRKYLFKKYGFSTDEDTGDVTTPYEKTEDAFSMYYEKMKSSQLGEMVKTKAYQLRSEGMEEGVNSLLEGTVSVKKFIKLSHEYNTTVGIMSASLFIAAISDTMSMREKKKPIVISVPVNLRQFFPTDTVRNFFGTINIVFDAYRWDGEIKSIVSLVRESFDKNLTKENIASTMNSYSALAENAAIKRVPLFLKEPVIRGFLRSARSGVTASLSNLERVQINEGAEKYIDHFAAFAAAPRLQLTIASYEDKMAFGTGGGEAGRMVMDKFYKRLKELGIEADFPVDTAKKEKNQKVGRVSLVKMLDFAFIASLILMIMSECILGWDVFWPILVVFITGALWADVRAVLTFKNNVLKLIAAQIYFLAPITLATDEVTGYRGWSVTFVFPWIPLLVSLVSMVVGRALKISEVSMAGYIFFAMIMSLVQAVILKMGINIFPVFAYVSMGVMLLLGAWFLVFKGRQLKSGIDRWFNL